MGLGRVNEWVWEGLGEGLGLGLQSCVCMYEYALGSCVWSGREAPPT